MIQANGFSCLTYNIHKGFSANNREYQLSKIRDALRSSNADVVALQEVLGEHQKHAQALPDWHHEAHFEYLADSVWHEYAYGKNAIYQHGHHGNALLSKFPFGEHNNHDLSQWRFSRRGLLHGVISLQPHQQDQEKLLHIACVHLGFLPFEQWRQTQKIKRWLTTIADDQPVVIMGDFNDWHLRIHRSLTGSCGLKEASSYHTGRPQPTFPASSPRTPLDRIYYRGLKLDSCKVLSSGDWSRLSDHRPIFAKFLLEN